jgi:cation transporter-like permease
MFIGHYGLGFMIKRKFREIPLWVLFLSVQLMDIIAFVLVFFGVEGAAYRDSDNPFFRNNLDLPYSHSLVGALLLSVIVYFIFVIIKRRSWAPIVALCVLSHWVIDLIVHTPDLFIFFGHIKTGLGLWNYPYLSFSLEIILVLLGWLILKYRNAVSFLLLFLLIGSFTGMFFGKEPDTVKNNEALRILMVLVPNTLFIVLTYFSERIQKEQDRMDT